MIDSATILITTKNRKEELRTALRSCLLQKTTKPVEVLVINDGSSDGTSEMVLSEFPTVRLVEHQVSAGLVQRRNEGALVAQGDIVISIDDDAEFSNEHTVQQTLDEFTIPSIGAVAIPFCNVNQGDVIYQRTPGHDSIYITAAFRGTAYAVRKEVFKQIDGYRSYFIHQGEEGDFCLRMLNKGYYVRLGSAAPIYHYESPNRSIYRMDYYGRRNDVLSAFLNVPMPYMLLVLFYTTFKGIYFGFSVKRPMNMLQGINAGYRDIFKYRSFRRPVKWETFCRFRQLCRTTEKVVS